MKLFRRILISLVAAFAVVLVGANWVAPVALSFYAARKVPAIAKVVPENLKDNSLSQALGLKLSYLGYEFEVPWSDLDAAKTELYPKDKPDKTRVVLTFRSGLRLMVTAIPSHEFASEFAADFKMPADKFEAIFGRGTAASDYAFLKNVYEFTPDKMHYWSLSPGVHYREQTMLVIKSIVPARPADTGIFNLQNERYKGFQQGDPRKRQDSLLVSLYADDGSVEFLFQQKNYGNAAGVTQPEINLIVRSLKKTAPARS